MTYYGIVGIGEAKTSVVHEGLADILESDSEATFLIHARKNPQGAIGDVYDFLVDNEVPYVAYTKIDDNSPKILLDSAVEVVKDEDPVSRIIDNANVILLLWDEKDEEASNRLAIRSSKGNRPIKDLTMALTPIVVEDAPEEEPVEKKEENLVAFTREELMEMSIGVLRRQAKAQGIENIGDTKKQIVDAILGEEPNDSNVTKDKPLEWGTKDGALRIRIDESGAIQTLTVDVRTLIDNGTLKPLTS